MMLKSGRYSAFCFIASILLVLLIAKNTEVESKYRRKLNGPMLLRFIPVDHKIINELNTDFCCLIYLKKYKIKNMFITNTILLPSDFAFRLSYDG